MKRILILANNSIGLYNFRVELIERLIEEKFNVYFTVPELSNDEKVEKLIEVGGNYIHTPMNRRGVNPLEDFKLIKNYKKIIDDIKPDVILTYTIKPNIYGNYVANKFNIPIIMNITGIGSSLATGKLKLVIKKMYKYAASKATNVFFQNQGNSEFFINNNLVKQSKTRIIPGSGVNIERFKASKLNKKDNRLRFLFIGRLMKDKGIKEYTVVAKNITAKYPHTEFWILGPYEENEWENEIEKSENSHIKYLGESKDVREEIKQVDCIVNPSYHEGMSNVLLEGAAMGKPLIASNISGCREIIDNGINGFLFKVKSAKDLEKKLIQFINLKEEERSEMGISSRIKIEKEFDRNIVVDEYINVINKILKDR